MPNVINSSTVVTRFAPSPTGFMHIGGVRTALYAWAFARKNKGTFILRIEDTDKEREVEGSINQIIDSLKWLNIDWNEGPDIGGPHAPYLQSQRLDHYKKYAQILVKKGLAYADPYSQEELDAFRKKSEEEKRPFLYRDYRPEQPPVWDGSQPLRLKITDIKSYEWHDEVRGDLKAGPEALDDFILIKSDGYPTYNFAHIIDDLEMGTTHIFRADEFISSTPKFLALYDALGIDRPRFATLPPILGSDGKKKLGKRDGAKDILAYKAEGYLSDAMMNFLAFIGWNPGTDTEIVTPSEFIQLFSLEKVHVSGGMYNEEKLLWINKEHLKKLSDAEYKEALKQYLPAEYSSLTGADAIIDRMLPTLRERLSYMGEIAQMNAAGDLQYFFMEPSYEASLLLCPEKLRKGKTVVLSDLAPVLEKTRELLTGVDAANWNSDTIKNAVWAYADVMGRGIVLWAMRVALSGKERSPDPFELAYIVGRDETLQRLEKARQLVS